MARPKSHSFERTVKISVTVIMVLATATIGLGALLYVYFTQNIPSIESLRKYDPPVITTVYADNGESIGEFFAERREVVSLSRMPNHLIQAFVAGEDSRFFQHKGIDYMAILRAFYRNIFSGEIIQGGSTITQQVVKSLLLTPEKSFARKVREAILAYRIEKYLTKEEILHLYLNQIYLGHGAYGVAAAADSYFGKRVEDLNLAESALLAGLTQAPSKTSPYQHPELAKRRQIYVLTRMEEVGLITSDEFTKASQTLLKLASTPISYSEKVPYFLEHVRKYIEEKYGKDGLHKNGLKVYTTIDLGMQRVAQEALESGLKELEKRQKYSREAPTASPEGALLCFDLESGYIKVMVGGRDYKRSQFNRATQARRQTGSSFKPIVYASALDKGYTPASVLVDAPVVFEWGHQRWAPKNYGDTYMGPITLRTALTHSVNVVTVKLAQSIGIDYIRSYAQKLGITSPLYSNLSMALGSSSLSLYELTRAYGIFANRGNDFRPIFIKKILDRNGNLLEENLPLWQSEEAAEEEPVLNPQTAYLMTTLLQSVVQNGTGWRAKSLGRPTAAKTGTTDEFLDAWFIGYTPELLTGVWVGFDDERTLGENETGARAASPTWVSFMSKVLKDKPVKDFPIPEGIEFMKVDARTGELNAGKEGVLECFKEGTGPAEKAAAPSLSTSDFFKFDFNLSAKPNQ